jgi:hypothetical protein
MANRAMAAKVERAAKQARVAAHAEFSKPFYNTSKPVVPAYDVAMVRKIPAGVCKGANELQRVRSGCDPRTRGLYNPGSAVRAVSAVSRGCYK